MELRHLRYFVAVAETQNVTRAAARLHVSQPPLTRQIHDLEAELGLALFERSGKSIHLTEAGRVFLEEARASLQRVDEAVRKVRAVGTGKSSELHLGYAPTPTVEILPQLLRGLAKQAANVRVILHDHSTPEMLAGLREGRLQAALMMQPPKPSARGVVFEKLRTYPIGVAVPPDHPFCRRRAVPMAELLREPIVAYARKDYPDYHAMLSRCLGANVKRMRLTEECDSGPSLITAVASGKGVVITASVITATAGKRLRFVPLVPPPTPAVVGIAYRAGKLTAPLQALVDTARQLSRPKT